MVSAGSSQLPRLLRGGVLRPSAAVARTTVAYWDGPSAADGTGTWPRSTTRPDHSVAAVWAGLRRRLQGSSVHGVSLLLLFNQGPIYEQLWRSASEHHMQGRHQECVIFAQMAAEVAADACLTRLIARAEPVELRAWLETQIENNANLARQPVRRLLNALSGRNLEAEIWWSVYSENNRLRNQVAHHGQPVDGTQARRGLQAVRDLITYLEGQAA